MPTVADSLSNFVTSVLGIFTALANSVLAVFQSILALAQSLVTSAIQVSQSLVALVLDLTQGVVGFAIANFAAIVVLGGGYYLYTTRKGANTRVGAKKRA